MKSIAVNEEIKYLPKGCIIFCYDWIVVIIHLQLPV